MGRNSKGLIFIISIFILISINNDIVNGCEDISVDWRQRCSKYSTYTNERYGFSIEYPSELIMSDVHTNNDRIYFSNMDNTVELTVWGNNNVEGDSAESLYYKDMLYVPKDSHVTWCNDYAYNLTWSDEKNIYHKYSIVGEKSTNTFTFKSPIKNREIYEYVIERLDKYFKTPLVNQYCW